MMKIRNNKKLTRASIAMAAVASVTAQAEIELAEGFSLQGFLDVSAQRSDVDGGDADHHSRIFGFA
tara:strand:+ start:854 stop:1051 length:198 start_codon:yes stop_codon:yes gene_type:complete